MEKAGNRLNPVDFRNFLPKTKGSQLARIQEEPKAEAGVCATCGGSGLVLVPEQPRWGDGEQFMAAIRAGCADAAPCPDCPRGASMREAFAVLAVETKDCTRCGGTGKIQYNGRDVLCGCAVP